MFGKKKKKQQDPFEGWREEEDNFNAKLHNDWPETFDASGKVILGESGPEIVCAGLPAPQGYIMPDLPNVSWDKMAASGSYYNESRWGTFSTGTVPILPAPPKPVEIDVEALWQKMYQYGKSIIVICRHCNSVNCFMNPTCIQCGAPLGDAHEENPLGSKP